MKILRRIVLCALLIALVWFIAVISFAFRISTYQLDQTEKADAIIVLTGGSGRVEYGLELLVNNRGKALFISGVSEDVTLGALLAKAPLGIREILGIASLGRITLGRNATNTIANAEESLEWIMRRSYKSALLVTADYHMPRALVEFKATMPDDIIIIPAVVSTRDYRNLSWLSDSGTRSLILSEFHKLIFAKIRHIFLKSQ